VKSALKTLQTTLWCRRLPRSLPTFFSSRNSAKILPRFDYNLATRREVDGRTTFRSRCVFSDCADWLGLIRALRPSFVPVGGGEAPERRPARSLRGGGSSSRLLSATSIGQRPSPRTWLCRRRKSIACVRMLAAAAAAAGGTWGDVTAVHASRSWQPTISGEEPSTSSSSLYRHALCRRRRHCRRRRVIFD